MRFRNEGRGDGFGGDYKPWLTVGMCRRADDQTVRCADVVDIEHIPKLLRKEIRLDDCDYQTRWAANLVGKLGLEHLMAQGSDWAQIRASVDSIAKRRRVRPLVGKLGQRWQHLSQAERR